MITSTPCSTASLPVCPPRSSPFPAAAGSPTTISATRCAKFASRCLTPMSRWRRQDLHRRRQSARHRRRSHEEPDSGTGLHQGRARGADAAHGRARRRAQSARAASGGGHARRPARSRQDHQRRQTRALADREAKEKSADGQHRRLSSGGHSATPDPGLTGGRGLCRGARERSAHRHCEARADRSDAAGLRRAAARHGGPFACRCRDDGGSRGTRERRSSRTSGCSSWTAWRGRTRSTPPRPSTTP